jgi:hypothetical protein
MLECDYLIVGAGASGMIFADELLTQTDADIIIVDRQDRPGGHWNHAYPFVALHQPSAFYGAGSMELGANRIASTGINAGLYEQASGLEVSAYFERLMRERFLPSGRVRFFPMTDYEGDWQDNHRICARLSPSEQGVTVRKRVVSTDRYNVSTPATHTRNFLTVKAAIATPGELPRKAVGYEHFAVLGAGKTSMDVLLWLLDNDVSPDRITWFVPRDSWLTNRETVQPGDLHRKRMLQSQLNKLTAYAEAQDLDDMFSRLEASEEIFRIDPDVQPSMHYGATVSPGELHQLRKIRNVVRMGRVECIEGSSVRLERGRVRTPHDTLFIDCTARGLNYRPVCDVFNGKRITLQMVRRSLVSLSAAATAFVEARYADDESRNRICRPIPYGDQLSSWIPCALVDLEAQELWAREPELRAWLRTHRLMGAGIGSASTPDPDLKSLARSIADLKPMAIERLRLLSGGGVYDPPVRRAA